jgi:hypothetical protein
MPPDTTAAGSVEVRAGSYELTMVATSGDSVGRSVSGHLELSVSPDSLITLGGSSTPFFGYAHVALDALGASRMPGLDSSDPMAPGVLVFWDGDGPAALRLGSDANNRTRSSFDGPMTMLSATTGRMGGFDGSWSSGTLRSRTRGHFCAVRQEPEGEKRNE